MRCHPIKQVKKNQQFDSAPLVPYWQGCGKQNFSCIAEENINSYNCLSPFTYYSGKLHIKCLCKPENVPIGIYSKRKSHPVVGHCTKMLRATLPVITA